MNLDKFNSEIMFRLSTCKRAEEADEVVSEAMFILEANEVLGNERYRFWKKLYDTLGERRYLLMEEEFTGSFNKIAILTRRRLQSFIVHEDDKIKN
ncbi:MAG: hypothetical protein WEB89_06775 [Balneolales bacterium]